MNESIVFSHVSAAAVSAYIISLMQKAEFIPWVQAHKEDINRRLRLAAAALSTAGISYTWNGTAHQLIINGITLSAVIVVIYHFIGQYALTHYSSILIGIASGDIVVTGKSVQAARQGD